MDSRLFIESLKQLGLTNYYGVPDSLLKPLLLSAYDDDDLEVVITPNEGNAIGMAVGHHIAGRSTPVVFMQNSGIGNAVNPLLSIAHEDVYRIPMVLIIGWRGEPGTKDEPQHVAQGKHTLDMLNVMDIPYQTINPQNFTDDEDLDGIKDFLIKNRKRCSAIVVSKGTFTYEGDRSKKADHRMKREDAIEHILKSNPDATVFATTGMISREVYETRERLGQYHDKDFLCVGGMGHVSSIALGYISSHLRAFNRKIIILDGDGSFIMHMGIAPYVAHAMKKYDITHYVLDNGCHASVGGGDTISGRINFGDLASAFGYPGFAEITDLHDMNNLNRHLVHVIVGSGNRSDLGRPKETPSDSLINFMLYDSFK